MRRRLLLCFLFPAIAHAQVPNDAARKEATAVRIPATISAPQVDGKLDDPAWANAQFLSDFTAKEPVEGAAPRAGTRIAFAYDEDALYVGARLDGERPNDVPVLLTRRDSWG